MATLQKQNSNASISSAAPTFKHEGNCHEDPTTAVFLGCGYCSQVFFDKTALEVHINLQHEGCAYSCQPAPLPKTQSELLHQKHTTLLEQGIPLSEVSRHNTKDDCWVAINGKVYDLTEFLERHPGGPGSIVSNAGKDASQIFNHIHMQAWIDQYLRPEDCLGNLGVAEGMTETYWHSLRLARIREVQEEIKALTAPEAAASTSVSEAAIFAEKGKEPPARFFGCSYCGEAFAEVQDLTVHIERFHEGEPFQCVKVPMPKQFSEVFEDVKRKHSKDVSSDIPLSEVARHNTPKDCWVAVNGDVWDLTQVLLQHAECKNAILAWAGRDASSMWDRVPGRFPSAAWNNHYLRPEALMGKVGPEPELDARELRLKELKQELKRLEGPSEAARAAAGKAAAASPRAQPKAQGSKSEEARFPKLGEIIAKQSPLKQFTREEVAKYNGHNGAAPYMIIHNRVYDLTKLLGAHPGGDDVLLSRAGTDATQDFEFFEHSEKSRVRRDQDLLVGELVPAERKEWGAEEALVQQAVATAGGVRSTEAMLTDYAKMKLMDAGLLVVVWYLYMTLTNRKPLSQFTYSRALRHMHLLMGVGIIGAVGTAQAASRTEGATKKLLLKLHRQMGISMLVAVFFRLFFRLQSGIPPRFPGLRVMQFLETQSLRAFYGFAVLLPLTGLASDYFLKWTSSEDEEGNQRKAKQAIEAHKVLGKYFQYAWLPFHFGYTTLYHYANGRGVVRKVSPFI